MRRALVLASLPPAAFSGWLFAQPSQLESAPMYLALCSAALIALAFAAHFAKGGRD